MQAKNNINIHQYTSSILKVSLYKLEECYLNSSSNESITSVEELNQLLEKAINYDKTARQALLNRPIILSNEQESSGLLHRAVHYAHVYDDAAILKKLLNDPLINPNTFDEEGNTPLYVACKLGATTALKELLSTDKVDVNLNNEYGFSPIYIACQETWEAGPMVDLLLAKGADTSKIYLGKTLWEVANTTVKDKFHPNSLELKPATMQDYILKPMERMGYKNPQDGTCYAYARMAQQAFLDETIDKSGRTQFEIFHDRAKYLQKINPDALPKMIEDVRQKRLKLLTEIKEEIKNFGDQDIDLALQSYTETQAYADKKEKVLDANEKRRLLLDAKLEIQIDKTFSEIEKINLELPAFFESILLYQTGLKKPYQDLLEKTDPVNNLSPFRVMPLVLSNNLLKQGGIVNALSFSGMYNIGENNNELAQYFSSIRETFKTESYPLTLHLTANNHSIKIGYRPKDDKFFIVDANGKIDEYKDPQSIAAEVKSSLNFYNEDKLLVGTEIHVHHKNYPSFKKKIPELKSDSIWQEIHKPNLEKSVFTDKLNDSWIDIAKKYGDIESFDNLIKLKSAKEHEDKKPSNFSKIVKWIATEFNIRILESKEDWYIRINREVTVSKLKELTKHRSEHENQTKANDLSSSTDLKNSKVERMSTSNIYSHINENMPLKNLNFSNNEFLDNEILSKPFNSLKLETSENNFIQNYLNLSIEDKNKVCKTQSLDDLLHLKNKIEMTNFNNNGRFDTQEIRLKEVSLIDAEINIRRNQDTSNASKETKEVIPRQNQMASPK